MIWRWSSVLWLFWLYNSNINFWDDWNGLPLFFYSNELVFCLWVKRVFWGEIASSQAMIRPHVTSNKNLDIWCQILKKYLINYPQDLSSPVHLTQRRFKGSIVADIYRTNINPFLQIISIVVIAAFLCNFLVNTKASIEVEHKFSSKWYK